MSRKPYMNAASKQAYVILQGADSALRGVLENQSLPRAVSGDIKRALYFLNRGRETWKESTDPKSIVEVIRIAMNSNLGLVDNQTKKLDKEMYERYLFGKEQIINAAEVTMQAKCSACDGTVRTECPLYDFYTHFEVPAWDPNHPHCEYSHAGTVKS